MFRRIFDGISAAALLASVRGHDEQKIRAQESLRPTPRKPERQKVRQQASPHRDRQRKLGRFAAAKQRRQEREIGTDPIYAHSIPRDEREARSKAWRKIARQWSDENAAKVI